MVNQGLVTVKSGINVMMKVVSGCDGHNAQKLAEKLKKTWPLEAEEVSRIAYKVGFGCEKCIIVFTETETIFSGDDEIFLGYKKEFQNPNFNPRSARGTADHVVIIDV
ncbi:hypothetical protein DRH27_01140 [Candidatus Falkowbacteria bacterium]|nr:MAG: hypothetical protein DRH27_01140 [Candidatus Falkowbacteria bacterium]